MSHWFLLAAALSALWFLVHLFMGGADVSRPLRRSSLDDDVRDTAWLCWHLVSGTLLLMAGLFGAAALGVTEALSATLLAGVFAAVGLWVPPYLGQSYRVLPQGFLFVPVCALTARPFFKYTVRVVSPGSCILSEPVKASERARESRMG
mgnify:CR=1 FL=1